ncbi:hypothetical protein GCM10009846_15870 [Agrococcus versicolor]|uniref:Protein kinase domain-containing protein n=1 Tax=Agrococcus versicolor TaxID=501482 RepID=A0ABN3AQM4_9MICO
MEEIAGHRVVRVVRDEGERRVLAAFGDQAVELHVGRGAAAATMAQEAAVLLAVPHAHLLPVLDVATLDDAVVLVRPSCATTAAAWLLARGAPRVGEVVTIAAPILSAVAALHAAGATAGRIDLHALVLDEDGCPSLVGVGAERRTTSPTQAWRASCEAVAADCDALLVLVDELVGACGEPVPIGVRDALRARDADAAADGLLEAWPAVPIEHAHAAPAPPRRARERVRRVEEASRAVRWAQDALAQLGAVRRPVWLAGGAGAVALAGALVLAGTASSAPVADAPASSASPGGGSSVDAAAPPTPEATSVEAAGALLAAREACLDAADDACLAAILDPTGAAAASTWRLPGDATLTEVAVLGDAVLVDVASSSEPASVLVVRTDAGWMLRDAWGA